jgi:nickel-dependent lactate racemase
MASITVDLPYGRGRLPVRLPAERTDVVTAPHTSPAADPGAAVRAALRSPGHGPPLRELVRPGQTVAISMCDGTRPQPRDIVIPAILEELEGVVPVEDVVVLVATGTHRGNTAEEIDRMLGGTPPGLTVVNHDARDRSSLTWLGTHGNGVPVWLNRLWVDADVRITTGFVEPHFFAGFSGGPKLVAPGLAALETVLTLHDAARIGHAEARWGVVEGNPVHDDIRAVVAAVGGVDFALDVLLDDEQRIVSVHAGSLFDMHTAAREDCRRTAMRQVPGRYPVVVTSNAGYPLDQNLYQCVKGMSAAAQVVEPGGTIVLAAACEDGFPDHGSFREVLSSAPSPQALLDAISAREDTVPDQWQVQVQARLQVQARILVRTDGLDDDALASAHLGATDDVTATVEECLAAAGPDARVCVLPDGPTTVPYVA